MSGFLVRRLLIAVPTLLLLSILSFGIIALAPGDAASALIGADDGGSDSAASREAMRARLGLNDPLPVRYWTWLSNVLRGNLGESLIDRRQITDILGEAASLTLQLTIPAFCLAVALSLIIGVWTGSRPYSRTDNVVSTMSIMLAGIPGFVLGLLLVYIFAVRLNLLPSGGNRDIGGAGTLGSRAPYFVLPLLTLTVLEVAQLVRYVRDSVISVRTADYVRTAEAKGLRQRTVLGRHVLRNAMLPFITIAGLQIPGLISGALLVEIVFGWGGLGTRIAVAVGQRDFPVIMGATLLTGVVVVIANLIADLLYALVDPRIRLA